ncbi:hypothetical protein RRG08_048809 [Elysia crispata]|uniref:C2H2-type domain-containing protein n=1 Tax=Elysia crispata TaxID=231223 RepID=A0AAE1B621_9GAST|nr:hypothetical protein RRG08_048809 [Elysia crispata]
MCVLVPSRKPTVPTKKRCFSSSSHLSNTTNRMLRLQRMRRIKVNVGTGDYYCGKCGRNFLYRQSLTRHKWKCDQSRILNCHICGKVFYRVDYLKRHELSHHQ